MGGSIGVTIRRANGETIKRCRWTNALPYYFYNVNFFTQDESYLSEYIARGEEMRDDWLNNKDKPKDKQSFKYNMSPVYGPYDTMSPIEYGLVVIDYKTKHVLSCQGYCGTPDFLPGYSLFDGFSIEKNRIKIHDREENEEGLSSYDIKKEFFLQKKMISYIVGYGKNQIEVPIDYSKYKDFNEFLLDMNKICEERTMRLNLRIDTNGWTVVSFNESAEGFQSMKEYMKEFLELEFNQEEENKWKLYLERFEE